MMPASPPLGFFFWRVRTVLLAVARCSFSMASRLDRIFRSCSQRGGKLRGKLKAKLISKLMGQLRSRLTGKLRGQLRGKLRGKLRSKLMGRLRPI